MAESFLKELVVPSMEGMLKKELSCPKCKSPISPPIYHCDKGHSFCNWCYKSGYDCNLCGSKCSGGRTHHLERIVELYTYPCKYFNKGCRKACKIQKLRAHEEGCQTFEMNCPFAFDTECKFIGNRQQIVFHCQLVHTGRTFIGIGPLKFGITSLFIDSITRIQDKMSIKGKKNKAVISFYMLYVDEVIFQVVCLFELEHVKVNVNRLSSPSEADDRYEFTLFFHNDADMVEAVISRECSTIGQRSYNPLFDNTYVKVDVEVLKRGRFCSIQIEAKN